MSSCDPNGNSAHWSITFTAHSRSMYQMLPISNMALTAWARGTLARSLAMPFVGNQGVTGTCAFRSSWTS